jgi:hypothetical protein
LADQAPADPAVQALQQLARAVDENTRVLNVIRDVMEATLVGTIDHAADVLADAFKDALRGVEQAIDRSGPGGPSLPA